MGIFTPENGQLAAAPDLPPLPGVSTVEVPTDIPALTNAELVQLRVRVVALENLVIVLLAEGTRQQLELARDMAAYISPRPGFTDHPLTLHAAAQMVHLVERAGHFRVTPP